MATARDDDSLPVPADTTVDRVTEGLLPCGHDPAFLEVTSGVHYNRPPNADGGALRIVAGKCDLCETPIREFYSGEHDGPFLTREAFDPDRDPHESERE